MVKWAASTPAYLVGVAMLQADISSISCRGFVRGNGNGEMNHRLLKRQAKHLDLEMSLDASLGRHLLFRMMLPCPS